MKNGQNRQSAPKTRLQNEVGKKFETALIGALDRFEKYFGFEWGHGMESKTDQQKLTEEQWQLCRKEILDFGNKQKRIAQKNIEGYDVHSNTRKMVFKVKD